MYGFLIISVAFSVFGGFAEIRFRVFAGIEYLLRGAVHDCGRREQIVYRSVAAAREQHYHLKKQYRTEQYQPEHPYTVEDYEKNYKYRDHCL